jgi:probable F420-dependent oxidoreductase
MRPFRFGVSVRGADSAGQWRAKAKRAEAAGFDIMLAADHLVDGMFPPLAALTIAAEATERIRVGTLVVNNDFRHPVLLAREAATVDLLTGGRLELGLGAGHMQLEYEQVGIVFDRPAVRVARLAEAAQIVHRLLAGEEVDFEGRHYRVSGHRCWPRPVQRPVPLLIGGNGRRVLTTAARLAEIVGFTGFSQVEGEQAVNPTHFTDAGLTRQVGWVRDAAGDRFDELELSTLVQSVTITADRSAALERVRHLVPSMTAADLATSPYALVGSVDEIADRLRDRRERLGITYVTVFERDLEPMQEVIARLR